MCSRSNQSKHKHIRHTCAMCISARNYVTVTAFEFHLKFHSIQVTHFTHLWFTHLLSLINFLSNAEILSLYISENIKHNSHFVFHIIRLPIKYIRMQTYMHPHSTNINECVKNQILPLPGAILQFWTGTRLNTKDWLGISNTGSEIKRMKKSHKVTQLKQTEWSLRVKPPRGNQISKYNQGNKNLI